MSNKDDKFVNLETGGEAAEIILGKPPRLLRFSIYLFAILILVALAWSYFSRIDITITAQGVVRPQGDLVKIQSLSSGKLLEVLVKEGQAVTKDQILFRIDGEQNQRELDKVQARKESSGKQLNKLKASRENLVLQHQAEEQRDGIAVTTATGELEKSRSSHKRAQAALNEAKSRLDEARGDYERTRKLVDDGILSQAELEAKHAKFKSAKAGWEGAGASLKIAEQEVAVFEQNLDLKKKQGEIAARERAGALDSLDNRILALNQDFRSSGFEAERIQSLLDNLEVKSPVAGIVTTIEARNPGEVVEGGKILATVAPEEVPWVVEAMVANQDAGDLREKVGAKVKLKFDAFPFRDYGTMEGTLLEVSHDARADKERGMVFQVRISLDSKTLERGNWKGTIQLGMTVIADIIKEEDRVLALLFRNIRDRVSLE